jgi:hypothetical protein
MKRHCAAALALVGWTLNMQIPSATPICCLNSSDRRTGCGNCVNTGTGVGIIKGGFQTKADCQNFAVKWMADYQARLKKNNQVAPGKVAPPSCTEDKPTSQSVPMNR